MTRRFLYLIIAMLCFSNIGLAQDKKSLNIQRAENAPKIDGILDDEAWGNVEIATDFIQFEPDIGNRRPQNERTEVRISYDDNAIYIGAHLYDDPTKIMKQLSSRDNFSQSDFFRVILNPNNDSQNDTYFVVFSSGQQADAIANPSVGQDYGWNAVWDSKVKIVDDGWVVEMKIPYRALRFADQEKPVWGLQFQRNFRRERAEYSWNVIDPTKGYVGLYHGELKGLNGIKPPIRLNLYPFSSGVVNSYEGETTTDLNFGMDVKYGVTDNFTLDATLVPDFSQAGFDRVVLNLGPFEQTFSEQRQFFTEGVDLFSKGGLFFSRRVGNAPTGSVDLEENEIADIPDEVKVLNAVKFSGRTKKGLGIGFFNAITEKTSASITDTITGEKRSQVVESLANYNIMVLDQQFNGNSSVSLINTNVTRDGEFRDANATALVANLINKRNTYRINSELRMSNVKDQNADWETGYSSFLSVGKVHGNLRYNFDHRYADTKYDINDLGLNLRNNQNDFGADISYQTFEPTGKLNNYRINGFFNYRRVVDPNEFARINFGGGYRATTRKLDNYRFRLNVEPGEQKDFFESRDGRAFIYENALSTGGSLSTNYNRKFAIDLRANIGTLFETGRDFFSYDFQISPRMRVNDNFILSYRLNFDYRNGDRGYATEENDEPIFGERNRQRVTNSITGNYNIDPFHSFGLTFRHYWDTVTYDNELFTLLDNGRLTTESGYTVENVSDDPNINFSTWNIDLSYSWQFAPGSFLTALYRNQLISIDENVDDDFQESLGQLFREPFQHTFSLRLQYFIDFNGIKSIFKNNKSAS